MPDVTPLELHRIEGGLCIVWNDGSAREYRATELRQACPCATCREKHSVGIADAGASRALPVLSLAEARPLRIESMRPVGNYAYNIAFSDGHDSGVFTFDFLMTLGDVSKRVST
ncbi:MAG: DUF971 domain-containing protein [Pirellulaceae bacterium]